MTGSPNTDLDLKVSRIIKAPRSAVWLAWTDPRRFEQWWIPAPMKCRVMAMDVRPGGAFVTEMSEAGGPFGPHLSGCFLEVVTGERIVFTTALVEGWRPADEPFITLTSVITLRDHPSGTDYSAMAMHRNDADRASHEEMGFHEGWGTVTEQLAKLVEGGA